MKIGIIGAGHIGSNVARHFARAGHEVAVSNSRGPDTLRDLVQELGPRAHAMTVEQAANWAELVFLAVPWRSPDALPPPDTVDGKIVIDAMNPYGPDGETLDLGEETSSETVHKRLPGARLVKAFNTKWFRHLIENADAELPMEERDVMFVAGDDPDANRTVAQLIELIGFAPVITGGLREGGRLQQPDSPLYNRPMKPREAREQLARLVARKKTA